VILALIPGLPSVELAPELVLLLVLPPVIYSAAVSMSWNEFRFNLRPISSPGGGMRRVHHRGGRGGNPLAPRPAVAGGFRAGRDRLAAGRRGAAVDPAQMQLPRRILVVSKGRDWPTTPPRSSSIGSRSPP
jgi:hypothetical protein